MRAAGQADYPNFRLTPPPALLTVPAAPSPFQLTNDVGIDPALATTPADYQLRLADGTPVETTESNHGFDHLQTGMAIGAATQTATALLGLIASKITANAQLAMQDAQLTAQAEQEETRMANATRDLGLQSAAQRRVKELTIAGNTATVAHAQAHAERVTAERREQEAQRVTEAGKTISQRKLDLLLYSYGVPHIS